jgi:hypothetical protein
VVVRKKNGK